MKNPLRCDKCKKTRPFESYGFRMMNEEAILTCPVCGTQVELSAKLKQPVMRSGAGGEVPPPLPSTPSPGPEAEGGGGPLGGEGMPSQAASWKDSTLTRILSEIANGLEPAKAWQKLGLATLDLTEEAEPKEPKKYEAPDKPYEAYADRLLGLDEAKDEKEEEEPEEEPEEKDDKEEKPLPKLKDKEPVEKDIPDKAPSKAPSAPKKDKLGTWEGPVSDFTTKMFELANSFGCSDDLGEVVRALQDGKALKLKGDQLVLDKDAALVSLNSYLQKNGAEDVTQLGSVGGLDSMGGMGLSDAPSPVGEAAVDDLDSEIEAPVPDEEPMPELDKDAPEMDEPAPEELGEPTGDMGEPGADMGEPVDDIEGSPEGLDEPMGGMGSMAKDIAPAKPPKDDKKDDIEKALITFF